MFKFLVDYNSNNYNNNKSHNNNIITYYNDDTDMSIMYVSNEYRHFSSKCDFLENRLKNFDYDFVIFVSHLTK
jgi:hypothetical protein